MGRSGAWTGWPETGDDERGDLRQDGGQIDGNLVSQRIVAQRELRQAARNGHSSISSIGSNSTASFGPSGCA